MAVIGCDCHENVVLSFGAALLQKKPAVCGELHLWQTQEIFHELQLESGMGNHPNAGHLSVEAQPPRHWLGLVVGEKVQGTESSSVSDLSFTHDLVGVGPAGGQSQPLKLPLKLLRDVRIYRAALDQAFYGSGEASLYEGLKEIVIELADGLVVDRARLCPRATGHGQEKTGSQDDACGPHVVLHSSL